jgi:hypothetical protein
VFATDSNPHPRVIIVKNQKLVLEVLEQRIAPSVTGTGGYDGQPGNQSHAGQNPSGSANPEGSANP